MIHLSNRPKINFIGWSNLSIVEGHRGAATSNVSPPTRRVSQLQTYFALKIASCRIFLVVSNW